MIKFLLNGNRDTKHFHLCKWDLISLPKRHEGWGLQNFMDFKHALAANSLWRVLTSSGIWHRVIKYKYLPHTTIISWFRSHTFQQRSASSIWGRLLKSIHLINHWLRWNPRSGKLIEIGGDRILGMGEKSFLSENFPSLHCKNIFSLAQAKRTGDKTFSSIPWLKSNEIGLSSALATEWDIFKKALIDSGAYL